MRTVSLLTGFSSPLFSATTLIAAGSQPSCPYDGCECSFVARRPVNQFVAPTFACHTVSRDLEYFDVLVDAVLNVCVS